MIPWLAQWLGLGVDLNVEQARQRHELRIAGSLNVTRGTRRSIELVLENALGMPGRGLRVRRGALVAEPGRVVARGARRDDHRRRPARRPG